MICARCNQVGCPNPQKVYMSAGQGDQCLEHLRARFTESEAALERVGYLKMDTEIAELQHKLKEAEEAIRKLGEESLRDKEKIHNLEKDLEWICPECNIIYPQSHIQGINLIAECGHVVMTKERHLEKRLADVENRESQYLGALRKIKDAASATGDYIGQNGQIIKEVRALLTGEFCNHTMISRFACSGDRAYFICDACEQVVRRAEKE